jgi:PIN domain nuclease of toxin-antitoxin system
VGAAFLTEILLDTHVWAWTLTDDRRISDRARREIVEASAIIVSAISFFEIAQKVRLGKWPEMAPHVEHLPSLLERQRAISIALEAADCLMAGAMDWPHRDPFDRFLAASAMRRRIPIVSADPIFDSLLTRIW